MEYFSSVSIDIEEDKQENHQKGGTIIFKMGTIQECLQDLTPLRKYLKSFVQQQDSWYIWGSKWQTSSVQVLCAKPLLGKQHKCSFYHLVTYSVPFLSKVLRALIEPLNSPCEWLLADFQLVQ